MEYTEMLSRPVTLRYSLNFNLLPGCVSRDITSDLRSGSPIASKPIREYNSLKTRSGPITLIQSLVTFLRSSTGRGSNKVGPYIRSFSYCAWLTSFSISTGSVEHPMVLTTLLIRPTFWTICTLTLPLLLIFCRTNIQ